jgi:hypothetical protein
MKKAGHQHRSRLNFARCLSSLKTPYCNRNRHTHIGNNLVCTGTTLFLKVGSMCLSAVFRQKIKLGTTNGFFLRRYLLDLAHALSTNEVPLTWGALRDLLTDLKTKARDNINAGFFAPHFFIILFTFNFTQASQSTFIIFSNTTMGFFKFTRDLNCSPQKPFPLCIFGRRFIYFKKRIFQPFFFSLLHRRSETNLRFLALCML